jgi:16S rRNA (guanine966-N2)-methyltransferase
MLGPMKGSKSKAQPTSVRVIGGRWKGRRIQFVADGIRPTADRVRETAFNWLMPWVRDACCLDMFAGSGALGLEALSRGASHALFVEHNRRSSAQLKANLIKLDCQTGQVIRADARKVKYADYGPFDIVFLDPPFDAAAEEVSASPSLGKLCTLIESQGCLSPVAHIYIELAKQTEFPELPATWKVIRDKTAGHVRFALLERRSELSESGQQE